MPKNPVIVFLSAVLLTHFVIQNQYAQETVVATGQEEVPDERINQFSSIEFGEVYKDFQLGLRNQFTDAEIEQLRKLKRTDPDFRQTMSSLLDRLGDRILFGLTNKDNVVVYSSRLAHLAAMNFAIGNTEDGTRLANRCLSIVAVFSSDDLKSRCVDRIAYAIKTYCESKPYNGKENSESTASLIKLLDAAASILPKAKSEASSLRKLGIRYDIAMTLAKLGAFSEASAAVAELVSSYEMDLEAAQSNELKIRILGQLSFLLDIVRKNLELAQGNVTVSGELLAQALEHRREQQVLRWKNIRGTNRTLPGFNSVWNSCVETGLGPRIPGYDAGGKDWLVSNAFFLQREAYAVQLLPPDRLPTKGQESLKTLRSTIYLKSPKVEKAILKFLNEPEFEDLKTVQILQFPLLEYELVNGKGAAAWKRFNDLQQSWKELSQDVEFREDFEVMSKTFSRKFNFAEYKNYLCTYFDNSEFRDLAHFNRRWKGHSQAFGYHRKIPNHALDYLKEKLEKQRVKKSKANDAKFKNNPKPTPAKKTGK